MLQFLSNQINGAYRKYGDEYDGFITGLTVYNLEHILKPTTEVKDSGEL